MTEKFLKIFSEFIKNEPGILLVCVFYDVIDFFIITPLNAITGGVIGFVYDLVGVFLGYKFFGLLGLINGWELFDLTNVADGFIPTLTLTYIIYLLKNK
ncbi:TPA_asm: hypothetical protein [Altiarchaeum virus]|nr:MAG: hypothetical protein BWK75_01190 [Candidatus Altiarchaeales archaeon A3]DAZ85515.1 TPA_asm: hypothetical protein [Altiarchaeum virus]